MTCEAFIKTRFKPITLLMIERANAILEEYAAQGFTLTVRQLFYQFVARDLDLANTHNNYRLISRTMGNGRDNGLIDWDYLEDRTRTLETHAAWSSPAAILSEVATAYREDVWQGQAYRPEVWVEKSALLGLVEPACRRWRVPYTAVRGFDSHSELYDAGKRFAGHLKAGLTPIVFHLGDHDPSGLAMTEILRKRLHRYARADIEVRRLALGLDQVRALRLPPNPAKESDSRYKQYVLDTGQMDSWELDALSPTLIDELLESAIRDLIDEDAWSTSLAHEELGRDQLRRIADES